MVICVFSLIKITSSACTLRWVFSAYFMKRLADLKNLFTAVDRDGSGNVSRDELSAALERKSSQLPDLAAFLNRAREKLGISDDAVCGSVVCGVSCINVRGCAFGPFYLGVRSTFR